MDHLDRLESRSIYVIREARYRFRDLALLWSVGKDSTTLVWLCRKAFFGQVPFPVLHIDTGYKFEPMYRFRDEYAARWGLRLVVHRNEAAIAGGMHPGRGVMNCCGALKTEALKQAVARHGFRAILLGIRRDEHGVRAKERYFSPRTDGRWDYGQQPAELWDQYRAAAEDGTHLRVHPLLHWTERDIWDYVRREGIPLTQLYFAREGKRYRSIGCTHCCHPVESEARTTAQVVRELATTTTAERAGRSQDKEDAYTMQKLRALGYM